MKRLMFAAILAPSLAFANADLVADNPALAALQQSDPSALTQVLEEIGRLQDLPYKRGMLVPTDGNQDVFDLLKLNPALADIHRRDPKATAKLLSIIQPQR